MPQSGSKPGKETPLLYAEVDSSFKTVEKWRFFGMANGPYP